MEETKENSVKEPHTFTYKGHVVEIVHVGYAYVKIDGVSLGRPDKTSISLTRYAKELIDHPAGQIKEQIT